MKNIKYIKILLKYNSIPYIWNKIFNWMHWIKCIEIKHSAY